MNSKKVDFILTTTEGTTGIKLSFAVRRAMLANKVPYCINMSTAYACLEGIKALKTLKMGVKALQDI